MSAIDESTENRILQSQRGNDSAHRIKHGEERKTMELRVEIFTVQPWSTFLTMAV